DGTLRYGDPLICGQVTGKVKALITEDGQHLKEALPGTPVEVLGFAAVPAVGSVVGELTSVKVVEQKEEKIDLFAEEAQELKLILKADRIGSLEALNYAITQIPSGNWVVRFILKETGDVNESDILLAATSHAIIIGFNVKLSPSAQKLADQEKVNVRLFNVIYELLDELKDGLEVLTKPKETEEILGRAQIKVVFDSSKGKVAGCEVVEGNIRRGDLVKVLRDSQEILNSRIKSLRYQKEDIPKASKGEECGILMDTNEEFAIGDIILAIKKI
ncbi:MAG: translation initiation factor IF-2, partial [Candidatus Paceibacterales bacterium]